MQHSIAVGSLSGGDPWYYTGGQHDFNGWHNGSTAVGNFSLITNINGRNWSTCGS